MHNRRSAVVLALAVWALPCVAAAQSFEGTLTQRTIMVDEGALFELFFAEGDDMDFDGEAEWIRYTADRLFSFPLEQLGQAAGVDVETVTMWVKGPMIRYEQAGIGADSYVIADAESRTTWIVRPSEASYFTITADDVEAAAADAARMTDELIARMGIDPEELEAQQEEYDEEYADEEFFDGFEPSVRSLDRTEQINGFTASAFEAVAGLGLALGWCAEDELGLIAAMEALTRMAGFDDEDEDEYDTGPAPEDLLCEGRLPVRTQVFLSGGGGQRYTVDEILTLERTPVSDDRFEVPSDYTERRLSDMWR